MTAFIFKFKSIVDSEAPSSNKKSENETFHICKEKLKPSINRISEQTTGTLHLKLEVVDFLREPE